MQLIVKVNEQDLPPLIHVLDVSDTNESHLEQSSQHTPNVHSPTTSNVLIHERNNHSSHHSDMIQQRYLKTLKKLTNTSTNAFKDHVNDNKYVNIVLKVFVVFLLSYVNESKFILAHFAKSAL